MELESSVLSDKAPSPKLSAVRHKKKNSREVNESREGDSLYQNSMNREVGGGSPAIDFPLISHNHHAASLKPRAHTRPKRD